MKAIKLFFGTIKSTITSIPALIVFTIIYAILLATFFRFIWIREATLWQVFVTYAFMILIPAEFFIFQSAIINRVRDQKFRWVTIVIDAVKFFIVAIPILLLGWLIYYLLYKWQLRHPAPAAPVLPVTAAPPGPQPLHWPSLIFATLRFVLLGVALPLAAIHLWIAVAGAELRSVGKSLIGRIGTALGRAFGPDSVLIYALGLIVFFVLPYVILVPVLTIKGNKTEFTVFVLRLLVSFIFTLIGWVVTISALTRLSLEQAPAVSPQPIPDAPPAEAAA